LGSRVKIEISQASFMAPSEAGTSDEKSVATFASQGVIR
jgi:hypothetical protein